MIPTITSHTTTRPMLSLKLNCPETRNQMRAAVQIPIQSMPYHGPLIFFIVMNYPVEFTNVGTLIPSAVPCSFCNPHFSAPAEHSCRGIFARFFLHTIPAAPLPDKMLL